MIPISFLKIDKNRKIIMTPEVGTLYYFFFEFIKSKSVLFSLFDEFLDYMQDGYTFVINNSMEGWNIVGYLEYNKNINKIKENPLNWIIEYISNNNLSNNSIKIYTADLNCNINGLEYSSLFHPIIFFNNFIKPVNDSDNLSERKFIKKFISLNRRIAMRDSRTSLYIFLKLNDILKDSYYSFNSNNSHHYNSISLEDKELKNESDFYNENTNFYKTSFCNIVTETYFDNMYHQWNVDTMFFSEKIFKPINNCQPFIVFGRDGYLKKLKELGFKTFDKWWDESYDNELNSRERMNKLLSIIKLLSNYDIDALGKIYKEMIPILKHNYELSINYKKYNPEITLPPFDSEIESITFKKIINVR